jgi:hypothetical protein
MTGGGRGAAGGGATGAGVDPPPPQPAIANKQTAAVIANRMVIYLVWPVWRIGSTRLLNTQRGKAGKNGSVRAHGVV